MLALQSYHWFLLELDRSSPFNQAGLAIVDAVEVRHGDAAAREIGVGNETREGLAGLGRGASRLLRRLLCRFLGGLLRWMLGRLF